MHFWSFWAKYWHFLPISSHARPKSNANKVPMWVPKLLLSPLKIFAPKPPNFARNWHFWSFWARLCWLIWCPVGGLVGGYGAQAVSRKTPIYFINYLDAAVFSCFPDRVKLSILLLKEGAVGLVTKRCPKLGYASHLNRNVKNLKQKVGSHKNPSISDFITWPSGRPHHPGELSSSSK